MTHFGRAGRDASSLGQRQSFERCLCGVIAAHPMYAAARGCRRRTDVDIPRGRAVTPPRGTKQELTNVHCATANIASDQVRVHTLEICWLQHTSRQDCVAKSGSEALYLALNFLQQVLARSIRHMAIRPRDMLSGGGTRGVKQAGLHQQDEWPVVVLALARRFFGRGNFLEAAS